MGQVANKPVSSVQVKDRLTGEMLHEMVPLYLRSIYQLMYQNPVGRRLVQTHLSKRLLKNATAKWGVKMDHENSAQSILNFIQCYGVKADEAELPLEQYKTFNEFFSRKLKPGLRPICSPDDPTIVANPADSRLLVFPTLEHTSQLWLKGQPIAVKSLVGPGFEAVLDKFHNPSVIICRLAPQDYHRWHMPVTGVVGKRVDIEGDYFSVSPRAVRNVPVFHVNKRTICLFHTETFGNVFMIPIGAIMVSSIIVEDTIVEGKTVNKGDMHGYFQNGGSTIVLLFEEGRVKWDDDILANSRECIETYVKVGDRLGRATTAAEREEAAAAKAETKHDSENEDSKNGGSKSGSTSPAADSSNTDSRNNADNNSNSIDSSNNDNHSNSGTPTKERDESKYGRWYK